MKKSAAVIMVLVVAAVAGGVWFLHSRGTGAQGVRLAPEGTVFFADLPDLPRTKERWKLTALHDLAEEPEVEAFLEKPKSTLPGIDGLRDWKAKVDALKPREAFVAVTSIETQTPKVVAGLRFDGRKEDLDPMLEQGRAQLRQFFPAGKDDLTKYGDVEVETFTQGSAAWGAAYDKGWYLVGDDVELLKATVDRLEGKGDPAKSLGEAEHFKTCAGYLPKESDGFFFADLKSVTEKLASLVAASGGQTPTEQMDKLKKIEAVAGALKLDGKDMRDAIFVLTAGATQGEPLARGSLALTSTNTLAYYAGLAHAPGAPQAGFLQGMASQGGPAIAVADWLGMAKQAFAAQGLDRAAFEGAFGPEYGVALDWPKGSPQAGLLFSLDVRDAAKAAKFLQGVMATPVGMGWIRQNIEGTAYYGRPSAQMPMLTPTVALTDKTLLAGLSFEDVKGAVEALKKPIAGVDGTELYRDAEAKVRKPTAAFGYFDAAGLCERVYGTLRPFAIIWANFAPKLRQYIDVEKLPQTETLTRHLGPIVRSESETADGTLTESVGPVTFNELLLGAGIGVGAAAVPALKAQGFPYRGLRFPSAGAQGGNGVPNGP